MPLASAAKDTAGIIPTTRHAEINMANICFLIFIVFPLLSYVQTTFGYSKGHTIAEKYADMYDLYSQCIRRGCVLSDDPLFTISERTDYLEGYISDQPYPYTVCVPVRSESAPADAVVLPECRVLSVLYCGDYAGIDEAWLTLGRKVKAHNLTPAGFPRVLGIVAPYTGREIETRRYCSRLVLPVEA